MRWRMDGSCRRTSELAIKFVREHIKSFPAFESHYTQSQNPERKYLNPELYINKMFNLYLEKCAEIIEIAVNEWTYRKIFKRDFKLYFHQPRNDTCERCDFFNMKIQTSNSNEEKAKLARKALQEDKILATENSERYYAFSFDLQKALPYPKFME